MFIITNSCYILSGTSNDSGFDKSSNSRSTFPHLVSSRNSLNEVINPGNSFFNARMLVFSGDV